MHGYETRKQQLVRLTGDTMRLLDNIEQSTELKDEGFSRWRATCRTITEQMDQETMRVAVVGAIKSGKSTLVNTILGGDYLKRGAGVVTSIVTRVRTGSCLRAILYLKKWDEINRDINEASVLLPGYHQSGEEYSFDLRSVADRKTLNGVLGDLAADQLIVNDTRSPGSVLLSSYLSGYDRVEQMIENDEVTVNFEEDRFVLHRDFVGDDALAVYLNDLLIETGAKGLGRNVEIADCQGSDSPNPFHLAMIQDYLMVAHLTIYVISSRTGLRQADIRFLTMIRKMGILETVVFVVNCDISEHDSLDSLLAGIQQIESDLKLICSNPKIFTFSALFTLLSEIEQNLSERDINRLAHWREEKEVVNFTINERNCFQKFLHEKINLERGKLLLKNHLERLEVVVGGMGNWVRVHHQLVEHDTNGDRTLVDRFSTQQERLNQTKRTLKNTLDGAAIQIKRNLKIAIDTFFNAHEDGVVDGVIQFIRSYQAEISANDDNLGDSGLANAFYMVFQAFKQALDAYMAETVNPKIIRFIKEQENALMEEFDELAGPYGILIDDAPTTDADSVKDVKPSRPTVLPPISITYELETIRKVAGLSLPPAAATMHYSTQIKTEAVMRFGLYKIVHFVKRVFKKPAKKGRQELLLALSSGVKRMKREVERSILFHLKDYKENIKFQYMLKLADAAAEALYQKMMERFQYYGTDLSNLVEQIDEKRLDKEKLSILLKQMEKDSQSLLSRINDLKEDLQLTTLNEMEGN